MELRCRPSAPEVSISAAGTGAMSLPGPRPAVDQPAPGQLLLSVRRACELLRLLGQSRELTVRAAATRLEVPPATAHRLLTALVHDGFAARAGDRGYHREPVPHAVPRQSDPPLESVHRALVLVAAVAAGRELSVADAAALLGTTAATAHRLLATLRVEGVVEQGHDRRYHAGAALAGPRDVELTPAALRGILIPIADDLGDRLGETVHLWLRNGPLLRLLWGLPGSTADAVAHDRWTTIPAHATASGRALLARLPNRRVDDIHVAGLPPWRATRVNSLRSLKRRLSVVRQHGFETTVEEGIQGASGAALCVCDPWGRPVAGIGVAVPSRRFSRNDLPLYREALEAASEHAEREIGAVTAGTGRAAPVTRRSADRDPLCDA